MSAWEPNKDRRKTFRNKAGDILQIYFHGGRGESRWAAAFWLSGQYAATLTFGSTRQRAIQKMRFEVTMIKNPQARVAHRKISSK